ncbi:hypothetical protein [Clostridium sp. chh4-2]|uniref:hypothetical protein n=1 Tax=Clostridium sp. chh4-2 TaxID=2067550 RepID=UPI0011AFACB7|nr:hypothetical protein [Clostridium sp. chh4-2]
MRVKLSISRVFSHLISGTLILSCQSLLSKITGDNTMTLLCIIIVSLGIFLKLSSKIVFESVVYLAFLLLYLISVIALVVFGDFKYTYFIVIHIILVTLIYLWLFMGNVEQNVMELIRALKNIMIIIAACSLFFYLFGTVLGLFSPSKIFTAEEIGWSNYNYKVYWYIYNEGQYTDIFGYRLIRNIGIFTEAPMYVYLLILALYAEMFLYNTSVKNELILIGAIITSLSSTGFIFLVIFLFIKYRNYIRNNKFLRIVTIPLILIVAVGGVAYIAYDKLMTGNISGIIRIDDLKANIMSFLAHPFIGNGYMNSRAMDRFRTGMRAIVKWQNKLAGNSSGLGGILSNGGLLFAWFYLLPLFLSIGNIRKNALSEETIRWNGLVIVEFVLLINTVLYIVSVGPAMNVICVAITLAFNKNMKGEG